MLWYSCNRKKLWKLHVYVHVPTKCFVHCNVVLETLVLSHHRPRKRITFRYGCYLIEIVFLRYIFLRFLYLRHWYVPVTICTAACNECALYEHCFCFQLCLLLLDTIVCYSFMPRDSLHHFVVCMCRIINVDRFTEETWKVRVTPR